ncbi:hypothetical protein GRI75_11570 [Altererythrobacter soli]|uniref:Uncharacterized protein n=1 Tax=Croceibacterium soli TaxID=1739690 RepID=A0A6I4UUG8_9SPHN|nr:hypothetical protein [Croceibacterium soli]MXP42278.1 hypothetical protein [Croceibacterium soli]
MMKLAAILASAALTLAGTAASAATVADRGEARLARMLEGRTAGEPVSCITAMRGNKLQVIDEVGLVYDAGDTVYVARPADPRMLSRNDVLVLDRFSASRLCVQEAMRTVDRHGGYFTGVVFLDHFVPYTKQG